jgi:hypothetical protein
MAKNKKDETVVDVEADKTAPEQAKEVRKEKEKSVSDKVDSTLQSALKANMTPEQKREEAITEARVRRNEALGINPAVPDSSAGSWKTGEKVAGHKMYSGDLTLKGVSQSGHEISTRVRVDTPKTEEELFYIFSNHHDSAVRAGFEIDDKNKSDPLLATPHG